MSRISYDFAGLGDLSGGLGAQFQRLDELATQLKNQVAALDSSWRSPQAKAAYELAQQNWDRVFASSREQLLGLQRGVVNASNVMRETDRSIASGFGGLA